MKICFTTALFGNLVNDRPARSFKKNSNYDYFMFSDQDQNAFDTPWDVFNINDIKEIKNISCPIRKSRYPKFMGFELIKSLIGSYDLIYYCDAHYAPRSDLDWASISKKIVNSEFSFAQEFHPNKDVRAKGIREEMKHIIASKRDTRESIEKTLLFFMNKFPHVNLNDCRYYANYIFGYSPKDEVKSALREFWSIYSKEDISYRDQPLWNLLLNKNKLTPCCIGGISNKFISSGVYGNHNYTR